MIERDVDAALQQTEEAFHGVAVYGAIILKTGPPPKNLGRPKSPKRKAATKKR
jgi:hypothetical protein